ncbi:MAG: hypothetical protein NVSMB16_09070 [Acidimicrobiales bacterium]
MISFAAQSRFAAEFLAFLISVAGLALVGLRPELLSPERSSRLALAVGFGVTAAIAFGEGSLLVRDRQAPLLLALGAVGLLLAGLGSRSWSGGRRSQRLLWAGLVAMAVALGLFAGRAEIAGDALLGIGAAAIGVALRAASGRSIAARVAASSAGILLVVVLILAVSLSAVLSSTVKDDAGTRLDARAALEASEIETTKVADLSIVARNVALTFASNRAYQADTRRLLSLNPDVGELSRDPRNDLYGFFTSIQRYLADDVALAYINQVGHVYAQSAPAGFDQGVIGFAVGSQGVKEAFAKQSGGATSAVQAFGQSAFVIAVQTVALERMPPAVGTDYPTALVAIRSLDDNYLAIRKRVDANVSLALVSRTAVLATAGAPGPRRQLLAVGGRSLTSDQPVPLLAASSRLYAARPLKANNRAVATLVAAMPDTVVTDVRDKLLRTLFLLAMAGTSLALGLAAYAGERLSGGIRILTRAAERIQGGDYTEPAGVGSEDEVGLLGAAFDSMASSISSQTTALQRAADDETALRNQLQAVVSGIGEALVAIDASGRVTLFNRAAEELIGAKAGAVLGRRVGEVLLAEAEDGRSLSARLQRPSPTRWATVATVGGEGSTRIPVAISASALRGPDDDVAGAVLVLRDLRPERQVEVVKNRFLSRIGHELRTPLTGINGYAEILLRRPVPEVKAREMYGHIFDAGKRLLRVVQMLEFSAAADAGRSLLRSEDLVVREVVDGVLDGWAARVGSDHRITRRVARSLPTVRGDRRWLTMAIDELVDNAVKFSPSGGRIAVSALPFELDRGGSSVPAVQITVVDEGVGMEEHELREAFDDFVQGDSSDTRRFGGLGLGLSLVKRVAEAHGGLTTAESVPQKGSKFSIVIPSLTMEEMDEDHVKGNRPVTAVRRPGRVREIAGARRGHAAGPR